MKIYMTPTLKSHLDVMSLEYKHELMGFLIGEVKKGDIYLSEVLLPDQQVSNASVNCSGNALICLIKKYKDKCSKIIGHWHSHTSMGCFWSVTDEYDIQNYMETRNLKVFIVSSNGNHLIRVELRDPINLTLDSCQYFLKSTKIDMLKSRIKKIIGNQELSDTNFYGAEELDEADLVKNYDIEELDETEILKEKEDERD